MRRRQDAAGETTRAAPSAWRPAHADRARRARRAAAGPCACAGRASRERGRRGDVLAGTCAELYLGPAPSAGADGMPDSFRHRILLLGNPSSRPEGLERVLVRGGFQVSETPSAAAGPPELLLYTPGPDVASVADEVRALANQSAYGGAPVFVLLSE